MGSNLFVHQGREEWTDDSLDLLEGDGEPYVVANNAGVFSSSC